MAITVSVSPTSIANGADHKSSTCASRLLVNVLNASGAGYTVNLKWEMYRHNDYTGTPTNSSSVTRTMRVISNSLAPNTNSTTSTSGALTLPNKASGIIQYALAHEAQYSFAKGSNTTSVSFDVELQSTTTRDNLLLPLTVFTVTISGLPTSTASPPFCGDVTFSNITKNSANFSFTISGGVPTSAKAYVYSSSTASTASKTVNATLNSSNGTATGTISGLTPNTTYYVAGWAAGAGGNNYSVNRMPVKTSAGSKPTVTYGVTLESTTTGLKFAYTVTSADTAISAATVNIYDSTGTTLIKSVTPTSTSNLGSSLTYTATVTGLTINTTYSVKAVFTNAAGTTTSTPVSLKTSAGSKPSITEGIPTFRDITDTSFNVIYYISSTDSAVTTSKVSVYVSGSTTLVTEVPLNEISGMSGAYTATITGLSANTTYSVTASATNLAGETTLTEEVTTDLSQIVPPIFGNLLVNKLTSTSAQFSYSLTGFSGFAVITPYVYVIDSDGMLVGNLLGALANDIVSTASISGLSVGKRYTAQPVVLCNANNQTYTYSGTAVEFVLQYSCPEAPRNVVLSKLPKGSELLDSVTDSRFKLTYIPPYNWGEGYEVAGGGFYKLAVAVNGVEVSMDGPFAALPETDTTLVFGLSDLTNYVPTLQDSIQIGIIAYTQPTLTSAGAWSNAVQFKTKSYVFKDPDTNKSYKAYLIKDNAVAAVEPVLLKTDGEVFNIKLMEDDNTVWCDESDNELYL